MSLVVCFFWYGFTKLEKLSSFNLAEFGSYTTWNTRKWRNKRNWFMNSSQKRRFTCAHSVRNHFHDETSVGLVQEVRVLHNIIGPASTLKTMIGSFMMLGIMCVAMKLAQWRWRYAKGSHRNYNADASFTHRLLPPTLHSSICPYSHLPGRSPNGFQGLSFNDKTIVLAIFLVLMDKTVSVGKDSLCIRTVAYSLSLSLTLPHPIACSGSLAGASISERVCCNPIAFPQWLSFPFGDRWKSVAVPTQLDTNVTLDVNHWKC